MKTWTRTSENIELPRLATLANLSIYHFAREFIRFKRSTDVTPHNYLLRKRVERAKDMLAHTDYSLTEVALAAGFSDQSHLARIFARSSAQRGDSFVGRGFDGSRP